MAAPCHGSLIERVHCLPFCAVGAPEPSLNPHVSSATHTWHAPGALGCRMNVLHARFRVQAAALIFGAFSVLFQGHVEAQPIIPVLLCAGTGGDVPVPHVPASTQVTLDMAYWCVLANPSGTVTFSSSDSLATMAGPLIYTQVDVTAISPPGNGWLFKHPLVATFTFRSPGPQALTASLPGNPFSPVRVPITVDPPVAQSIPTLGALGLALLSLTLALLGFLRFRAVRSAPSLGSLAS